MPKHLLIVESPAKAKTIEKYLGKDFTVKASMGHVRDLAKGDNAIDVKNGFKPKYVVIDDKKKVISELKKIIKKVDSVWLATDEDREGEAISWHLTEALGLDPATTKRIVFNEITKSAITAAVENPRTIDLNLVNGQQARRVLDRLVGFGLSPILWKKVRAGLSAGRVQSVAVRLIADREREINAFEANSAFRITAHLLTDTNAKVKAELARRPKSGEEAQAFLESCKGAEYRVKKLETKPAKKSSSAPFTTSTLQQEASRKLSFSVAQTMRVAQGLYEAGKITYMRTDSVHLSDTALGQAAEVITRNYGAEYSKTRQHKTKQSSAQEAHEAIRPTDFSLTAISDMDHNAQRLYQLIWKRAIASQMADAQLEKTTADIEISTSGEILKARGEVLKFEGFLKVYLEGSDEEKEDEDSGVLPPMEVGMRLSLREMLALERFTRAAPRYTEASLVKKLEELGIGRPSTYAPTISTIQRREYVVKESRDGTPRELKQWTLAKDEIKSSNKTEMTGAEKTKLFPTDLGLVVNDFLVDSFPNILDFTFTAQVEAKFDRISEGKQAWTEMISEFYSDFEPRLETVKETAERASGERELGVDPKSGKKVIARLGRYGPMVQIGSTDDEEKPSYSRLRANQRLESITLEEALELFKMPRILGEFEEQPVKANIGRFGPYVQLSKLFVSLGEDDDVHTIGLDRAIELIVEKREKIKKALIKRFNDEVSIIDGRWGPFIKHGKANVKIPKDLLDNLDSLTLEDCDRLLEEHKKRPKGRRGGGKKKAKK